MNYRTNAGAMAFFFVAVFLSAFAAADSINIAANLFKGKTKAQVKKEIGSPPGAVWHDERHPDGSTGDTWIVHDFWYSTDTEKRETIMIFFNEAERCCGVAWR